MLLPTFLALSSSVLLASHASALFSDADDADSTTTALKGFSFAAQATPNADKGSSNNHTLLNEGNMEVRRLPSLALVPFHSLPTKYTGRVTIGGHGDQFHSSSCYALTRLNDAPFRLYPHHRHRLE